MAQRTRWLSLVIALVTGAALLIQGSAGALPSGSPKVGMVCTPGSVSGNVHTFDLVANTGTIETPDGNTVLMWSYSVNGDPNFPTFQSPGPVLCVTEGETVVVNLSNTLSEATSIVFPGQDSEVTATGGTAGPFTTEAPAGGSVSYRFSAGQAGTYLYESGSDPAKQIEMGMYGALAVRPSMGPGFAYDDATTAFDPDHEYLLLLADIDPALHHAVETGSTYDANALRSRYFTINGRAFPDTIQDNGSSLLPNQPYGALVRIQPNTGLNTQPSLIRMINVGAANHPFHPHGNHTREIAQDGRLLLAPSGGRASTEHFGETIGSGQTEDFLLRWDDPDQWDPNTNPFPIAQPNYRQLTFKDDTTWYAGTPYLGYKGTLPTGVNSLNLCGEWYFPLHSHALNEFSNFDEGFGGMGTLLRVDPPGGCFGFPTATKISSGTLAGGSVNNLGFDDSNYYRVNSTTSGTRASDWYGQFSGIPKGSLNLKVTYKGNDVLSASSQNFDSLASSGTSSVVPAGWAFAETGTGANSTYTAGTGSSSTADTYSFGATGSTDRAFGGLRGTGTNTFSTTIGSQFTNNSGGTITSLGVAYTGEEWRLGASGQGADRLDFQYSTNATSLTTGTWNDVNSLDFTSPVTTGATGAKNGNVAPNRAAINSSISGLSIPNGATYWIRWTDFDRGGSAIADDGLAVDNFSITPGGPTVATTVSIWNWSTTAWVQLDGPTQVGAADVLVSNGTAVPAAPAAGSWASYIGTGANKGLVRVRVLSTGAGANFVTGGNLMKLVYDAP
jgi:Multicopper oxidase